MIESDKETMILMEKEIKDSTEKLNKFHKETQETVNDIEQKHMSIRRIQNLAKEIYMERDEVQSLQEAWDLAKMEDGMGLNKTTHNRSVRGLHGSYPRGIFDTEEEDSNSHGLRRGMVRKQGWAK